MKIIIATGLRGEMQFNKRRVSRDEYLIDDIMKLTGGKLTLKPYSAKLFAGYPAVKISDSPLSALACDEWCFVEDADVEKLISCAQTLVIYNFNRTYPSDVKFDTVPTEIGFKIAEIKDFAGHSHDKITRVTYERI